MKKVIIIGGGMAGLICSIKLAREGVPCVVVEKKSYPFHRVCGEYISNEVVPFLRTLKLYPEQFNPAIITRFMLSAVNGKAEVLPLDLGGFGISRYTYDTFLVEQAKNAGVEFLLNTEVHRVTFLHDHFEIETTDVKLEAEIAIGAFGKRSKLDVAMNRDFVRKRSPYVGVKYHVRLDHPRDLIGLHNFSGGYCGISCVEDDRVNLCYLTHRRNLKQFKNIRDMEHEVLFQNPQLQSIFNRAEFLIDPPETINEISFETKSPVEDHMLMVGDSAGMITPLCGNGMAMAIHAAKILSALILKYHREPSFSREQLERTYAHEWSKNFSSRLWAGRQIQKLFGNPIASKLAVNIAVHVRPIANFMVSTSHGKPFT